MARVNSTGKEAASNFSPDNGTGLAVRTAIKDVLESLRTVNSGSGDPSGAANVTAYQMHINEVSNTSQILKIRNKANDDFVVIGDVAQTNLGLLPLSGGNLTGVLGLSNGSNLAPSLTFSGDTDTGFYLAGHNFIGVATAGDLAAFFSQDGLNIFQQKELRLHHQNVVASKYLGFKAPQAITGSSVTFTLPDGDGSAGQFLKTDGSGNLSFGTVSVSNAASALTGNTLASGVTASSLTSVGTLTSVTVSGDSKLSTIKDSSGNNPSTVEQLAQGRAKAWINFNGTTVTSDMTGVRDSFNVSSVTDNGTGQYTVSFSTNMDTANYCVVSSGHYSDDAISHTARIIGANNLAQASYKLFSTPNGGTAQDSENVFSAVFGD